MLNPIGSNLDVHGVENLSFYALMGAIPRNTSVWRSWRA
jgi:hypothetical protein